MAWLTTSSRDLRSNTIKNTGAFLFVEAPVFVNHRFIGNVQDFMYTMGENTVVDIMR